MERFDLKSQPIIGPISLVDESLIMKRPNQRATMETSRKTIGKQRRKQLSMSGAVETECST